MKTLMIIACLFLFIGCGARKVTTTIDKSNIETRNDVIDKSKDDETKTSEVVTNVKIQDKTSEKGGNSSGLEFTTDKPVEITKDGIKFTPNGLVRYNTNNYYESIIDRIRDSSSRMSDSLKRVINNDRQEINSLKQETYSKAKNTDSEGNVRPWALAVFGVLGLAVIAYFVYKYFTNPKRFVKG